MAWSQSDFEAMYSIQVGNPAHELFGQRVGYGRVFAEMVTPYQPGEMYAGRARGVMQRVALQPNIRALVVGCGFGYLLHQIRENAASAMIWGTDTSAWIHANKSAEAYADTVDFILDIDVEAPDAQAQLQGATGDNGKFNVIITDDMIHCIPAAGRAAFYAALEALLNPGGKIVHIVQQALADETGELFSVPTAWQQRGYSWLKLSDWEQTEKRHIWIAGGG